MNTKLYSVYDLPFDHDVCHLFEHIVMREFLAKLNELGYSRAFFGWLNGHTIDSTIFFDLGAYSDNVIQLFDEHLATLRKFDSALIDRSISHVEAEMQSTIEVTDRTLLAQQLQEIACLVIKPAISQVPTMSPLHITYTPKLFREVAILVNVYDISEETKKAFLCLYPALLDIIRDASLDSEAAYPCGKSALAINTDGIGIAWRFAAKNTIDIAEAEYKTRHYLQRFNINKYIKHLDEYRGAFARTPGNNAMPIQFYEQTGIKSTKEELAKLATYERMTEIINAMTVRIEFVTGKLKSIEWDN